MKASFLDNGGTKYCLPRRGAESGNGRTSRKVPTMMVSATVTPHRPTKMVLEKAMHTTLSTTKQMRESKYKDNWFDLLAIHYLTKAIQATTGTSNKKQGYEGLVEAAAMISKKHETKAQQNLVIQALQKAFPVAILTMIKIVLPPSTFSREISAAFTTLFFPWLIGPCEVRESEVKGKTEKNVVFIPKCRFLESTNCVGMCTNLCKIPSQSFIQDSLGMPVYMNPKGEVGQHQTVSMHELISESRKESRKMKEGGPQSNHLGNTTKELRSTKEVLNAKQPTYVPGVLHAMNFEDMSCEMIFGQQAPIDDPSLKQPCYHKSCIAKQTCGVNCS